MVNSSHVSGSLISKIQHILLYQWDPIGVSDIESAHDEYEVYGDYVFNMLNNGCNSVDIERYLYQSATDNMGLDYDGLVEKSENAAQLIYSEARAFGFAND